MKRSILCSIAFSAILIGSAQAQEMVERRISAFDFGVYAGGAISSPWYTTDAIGDDIIFEEDAPFGIGYTPAFGAIANYWLSPGLGVRLHYAYLPSRLPFQSDGFFDVSPDSVEDGIDPDSWPINNHLYDLSVVLRPFVLRPGVSELLASVYLFAGGGGLTTDVAGSDPSGCAGALFPFNPDVCLPTEPERASVGQGTLGAGMDLLSFSENLALFGEVGVHGYDSPVHVEDDSEIAEDRFTITPRLVAGVKLSFGNLLPPSPPLPPPPAPAAPPPPPAEEVIQVCVIEGTTLGLRDVIFLPAENDTVVVVEGTRRPFNDVYPAAPPTYATGADWFTADEPVQFMDRPYEKVGLARIIRPAQLGRIGDYRGVSLFAAADAGTPPEVIYLPIRPGCQFQPYQLEPEVRGVRG